jgi:hypothetical protein
MMSFKTSLFAGVALAGVASAVNVVGPTATLNIVNKNISPDGSVTRS